MECILAGDGISRNMIRRPATGHVACLLKMQIPDVMTPSLDTKNFRVGGARPEL